MLREHVWPHLSGIRPQGESLSAKDLVAIVRPHAQSYLVLANDTTHVSTMLQEPACVPQKDVDNTAYDMAYTDRVSVIGNSIHLGTEQQITHYYINMPTFLQFGKWFDDLRSSWYAVHENIFDVK